MASADVRAAVAAYFQAQQIPGLNKVHPAPPYWADGSEWDLAANLGSGAIAGLHLVADSDTRLAVPAVTGVKVREYELGLMLFYQWLLPSNSLTPADEAAWAGPLDVIIDGVVAAVRADPNLGAPGVILQAGQDAKDIHIQRDLPRRLPGKVVSWSVVEFSLYEVVTA
jgi:hypothetical protein